MQEFGNEMFWISLDRSQTNVNGKKTWAQNKKGKAGQMYTTSFLHHKKQLLLGFKLEKPIEL